MGVMNIKAGKYLIDYTYERLDKHPIFKDRPYKCTVIHNGRPVLKFRARTLEEAKEHTEKLIKQRRI